MYGTVARLTLKPGSEGKFRDTMKSYEGLKIDGYLGTTVYKLDMGANDYMMAVVFRDKDAYFKNADSPEQSKRFEEMRALLASDPEWNDGEVIYREG